MSTSVMMEVLSSRPEVQYPGSALLSAPRARNELAKQDHGLLENMTIFDGCAKRLAVLIGLLPVARCGTCEGYSMALGL